MERGHLIAIGVFAVALILFFFLAPVISMNIYPCLIGGGKGCASLSYYTFHQGETIANGQLRWLSQNLAGCF